MKKILIILGLIVSCISYSQYYVPRDTMYYRHGSDSLMFIFNYPNGTGDSIVIQSTTGIMYISGLVNTLDSASYTDTALYALSIPVISFYTDSAQVNGDLNITENLYLQGNLLVGDSATSINLDGIGLYEVLYKDGDSISSSTNFKNKKYTLAFTSSQGTYNVVVGDSAGYTASSSAQRNTIVGHKALYLNNAGDDICAIGYNAGYSTTGNSNVYLGSNAGYYNTSGLGNILIGHNAGKGTSTFAKNNNVMIGRNAGQNSNQVSNNIFIGYGAGLNNTVNSTIAIGVDAGNTNDGTSNMFIGYQAGNNHSTGNDNTIIGYQSGFVSNSATQNTFLGSNSGYSNQDADQNTFIGAYAGYTTTTGNGNSFFGNEAGFDNSTGTLNSLFGNGCGISLTGSYNSFFGANITRTGVLSGQHNSGNGYEGMYKGTSANYNVFLGSGSLYNITTGDNNVGIGYQSGYSVGAGIGNIFIGYQAGYNETGSNKLYIENSNADSAGALIYGEFDNNKLQVNGQLIINGNSQFIPQTTTPTYSEGQFYYDNSTKTFVAKNDIEDFSLNVGEESVLRCCNKSGSQINNGRVVYINASYPSLNLPTIKLADASDYDKSKVIGFATVDIPDDSCGIITLSGLVRGLNTSSYTDSTHLWLSSSTPGALQDSAPLPPYWEVEVGQVVRSDNDSGVILATIQTPKYNQPPHFVAKCSDSTRLLDITQNVYSYIPLTSLSEDFDTVGFSVVGDSVYCKQNGSYINLLSMGASAAAVTADSWKRAIFVNGVKYYSQVDATSSTNQRSMPLSVYIELNAGDWISWRITSTTSSRDINIRDYAISLTFEY